MWTYLGEAFMTLCSFEVLMLCIVGGIIGIVLGAVPGLSGGTGMMLVLPMTYAMDPVTAVALLCSIYVGGVSGGFIGSILVGIPGTNGSVATVFDGYEFTKRGDPVTALSVGTVANFIGTLPSVIIAMFCASWVASFAVNMGPWELFSLSMCAMVMVSSLSEGNMMKGLMGVGLGLAFTTIGRAPVSGTVRFTFGSYHLSAGLPLVCVCMGVFAGRTILLEYAKAERMGDSGPQIKVGGFKLPKGEYIREKVNIIRSFIIGLFIGFLPGLGSGLSNVVAYTMAKNGDKHPEKFGTGCTAGVWAPEVANNASVGGAIIPMIALGIPGDAQTALLLSGFVIQGVEAGPLLIRNNPSIVYMIYASLIFCAVAILLIEVLGMRAFPMLLKAPYHLLYPAILVLCFVGAYVSVGNTFAIFLAVICTLFGVWMAYANIPTTPFLLAFILGSNVEKYLRNGVSYSPEYGLFSFFVRPVSCALLLLAIFLLFWPMVRSAWRRKHPPEIQVMEED